MSQVSKLSGTLIGLVISLCVGACSHDVILLPVVDPGETAGAEHAVIVATNRSVSEDERVRYSDGRIATISYDDVTVWVPEQRTPGTISYPSELPQMGEEFAATAINALSEDEVVHTINRRLALEPQGARTVFVFVHGYNVSYPAGVYRHAQLLEDFGTNGVAVHFSWPSSGRLLGYVYDRDSIQFARDDLAHVLTLVGQSEAESIFLMGHSMGTLLVMEALRQLSLTENTATLSKISPVILASPDIDVDVFQRQFEVLSPRPDPFVVIASRRDRALQLSDTLRGGHPRVGEGRDIERLQEIGVAVFDLSDIQDGDRSGHSTFASSPTLINLFSDVAAIERSLGDAEGPQDASLIRTLRSRAADLIHPPDD